MKPLSRATSCLLALVVVAGCATTDVSERQRYEGAQLARPDHIIVHDFTANPAEVPPESAFAAELASAPTATPEQLEVGGRLGAQVAKELVAELRRMGLPAVPARRAGRQHGLCHRGRNRLPSETRDTR